MKLHVLIHRHSCRGGATLFKANSDRSDQDQGGPLIQVTGLDLPDEDSLNQTLPHRCNERRKTRTRGVKRKLTDGEATGIASVASDTRRRTT